MAIADFGSLSGLRAAVTGSSTGIGRAIACEFARAGARVVVHCRSSLAEAQSLVDEIHSIGQAAEIITAELANLRELDDFADRAWNCFGGIDIWVNNAGADLLTGDDARLPYAQKLQKLFEVDVRSTALLSRIVGTRMAESAGGSILNIGWDQADRGMAGDSGELFAAAKNAVMGLTRSLAVSFSPRVRVNCIAPGWIRTAWGETASDSWHQRILDETPLARWGTPDDVAKMARFLASADAAYITGQVINVNGGAVR
ncbi:MAG: SDR family oxidoreductase [Planctomycetaceae bacterium]